MTLNEWVADPPLPTRTHMNGYTDPAPPTAARYRVPNRSISAAVAVPRACIVHVGGTGPPLPAGTVLRHLEGKQGYPRRRLAHGWRSHLGGTVLAAATLIGLVVLAVLLVLVVLAFVWGLSEVAVVVALALRGR